MGLEKIIIGILLITTLLTIPMYNGMKLSNFYIKVGRISGIDKWAKIE